MKTTLVSLVVAAVMPALSAQDELPQKAPPELGAEGWASIRAAHEAWKHGFVEKEGGKWEAVNPGQGWRMEFDGRCFTARPRSGGCEWGLEMVKEEGEAERQRDSQPQAEGDLFGWSVAISGNTVVGARAPSLLLRLAIPKPILP